MKPPISMLFGTVAACCLALHASGQSTTDDNRPRERDEVGLYHRLPRLGRVEEARKLIGMEVRDSQGQKVGRIKDMAIDLEAGRVAEILVTARGPAESEGRVMAVPPEMFRTDEANAFVRVNLDTARLEAAPVFDYGRWGQSVESARVAEVYQYYNVRPWFLVQGQLAVNHITQPTELLGYLKPASKLIGSSARNFNFERLGKVEDLSMDLSAGRVVDVIIGVGGFAGMGNELCAVPPQVFQYNSDHSEVLLDSSKDALKAAPHFKSGSRAEANQPEHILGVYRFYKVEPYFSASADNSAQNVRDHESGALTPTDQSTGAKKGSDATRPDN